VKVPFFGIAVANFNHSKYLEQALSSIFSQDFSDWELGIIDDASTDTSWEVIQSLLKLHPEWSSRIFLCRRNPKNLGVCLNRNEIFSQSSADYLIYLDADDFFLPGFFRELHDWIKSQGYPQIIQFLEKKLDCQTSRITFERIGSTVVSIEGLIVPRTISFHYAYSRGCFLDLGGFDDENFHHGWEDWDFVIRALQRYHGSYFQKPGLVWRVNQVSRSIRVRSLDKAVILEMIRISFSRSPVLSIFGFRDYLSTKRGKPMLHVYPEDLERLKQGESAESIWDSCSFSAKGLRVRPSLCRYRRV